MLGRLLRDALCAVLNVQKHDPVPPPPSPAQRLAATLRPDPDYRLRRLRAFDRQRRERALRNIQSIREDMSSCSTR